jgi:hypothetical protein
MQEIIIQSQRDLDKVPENFEGLIKFVNCKEIIYIEKSYTKAILILLNCYIESWGSSQNTIKSFGSSQNTIKSFGSSQNTIESWESSQNTIKSWDSSQNTIKSLGSSKNTIESWDSSQNTIEGWGSSQNTIKSWGPSVLSVIRNNGNLGIDLHGHSIAIIPEKIKIKKAKTATIVLPKFKKGVIPY